MTKEEKLHSVLKALTEKLTTHIADMFKYSYIHDTDYDGPPYAEEFKAAKELLKELEYGSPDSISQ